MPIGIYKKTPEHIQKCIANLIPGGQLGKHWRIKDTSNMRGRHPKSEFKKGMVSWNKGSGEKHKCRGCPKIIAMWKIYCSWSCYLKCKTKNRKVRSNKPRIKKTVEELLAKKRFRNQRYKAKKRNADRKSVV